MLIETDTGSSLDVGIFDFEFTQVYMNRQLQVLCWLANRKVAYLKTCCVLDWETNDMFDRLFERVMLMP